VRRVMVEILPTENRKEEKEHAGDHCIRFLIHNKRDEYGWLKGEDSYIVEAGI
jgi:hypothetical protein